MAAGVKMTGDWSSWLAAIDGKQFHKRLVVEVRKSTLQCALYVKAEIRGRIRASKYLENSPLTLAIKAPKTKPLSDKGSLWAAIAHEVVDAFTAFVGLSLKRAGKEAVNIGIVLHEGAVVPKVGDVTQAMRAAVFARMRKNKKGAKKFAATGGPAKKKWIIPSRPFIRAVVDDPAVQQKCRDLWQAGFARALFGAKL